LSNTAADFHKSAANTVLAFYEFITIEFAEKTDTAVNHSGIQLFLSIVLK